MFESSYWFSCTLVRIRSLSVALDHCLCEFLNAFSLKQLFLCLTLIPRCLRSISYEESWCTAHVKSGDTVVPVYDSAVITVLSYPNATRYYTPDAINNCDAKVWAIRTDLKMQYVTSFNLVVRGDCQYYSEWMMVSFISDEDIIFIHVLSRKRRLYATHCRNENDYKFRNFLKMCQGRFVQYFVMTVMEFKALLGILFPQMSC